MSQIRATTISDLAGTGPATLTGQYAAKAWVNFNASGTLAIRQSGNVSSVTDNGVGSYTVNFASTLVDDGYAACAWMRLVSDPNFLKATGTPSSSSISFEYTNGSGVGGADPTYVWLTITR